MIRLGFSIDLSYEVFAPRADFIFNVQAARTRQQRVIDERLSVSQPVDLHLHTDEVSRTRHIRLTAHPGPLVLHSDAVVEIEHHIEAPDALAEMPVVSLPAHVLPFLYPSRYCESDQLQWLARTEFGALPPGYLRVVAIRDWVRRRIAFRSGASDSSTSALGTLANGAGVCRDFAHVMIALCRALNMPARFMTGFDFGADPALGPPDFHAYVEVYLAGRWYLFDPSGTAIPMGLLRLACGRDAADAAFATIFGMVNCHPPVISVHLIAGETGSRTHPAQAMSAISTDSGAP
jgi:transglutaminase-like putative cysteine protease